MNETDKNINIWFDVVSGPLHFCEDVSTQLKQRKCVLMKIPSGFAWKDTLRSKIKNRKKCEGMDFREVDAEHDLKNLSINDYILNEYTDLEGFRGDFYDYMKKRFTGVNGVNVLWIKNVPPNKNRELIQFLHTYTQKTKKTDCPLIVLETQGDCDTVNKLPERIFQTDWDCYIKQLDLFTFCNVVLSDKKMSENRIVYFANLLSCVCGNDINLCSSLIGNIERLGNEEILDVLHELATAMSNPEDCSCCPEIPVEKQNAVCLSRSKSVDAAAELEGRVRIAQIKVLMPIIELKRLDIIRDNRDSLEDFMEEYPDECVSTEGEQIQCVDNFDIGNLYHMIKYDFLNRELCKVIQNMRNIRNKIAHNKLCTLDDVSYVLDELH